MSHRIIHRRDPLPLLWAVAAATACVGQVTPPSDLPPGADETIVPSGATTRPSGGTMTDGTGASPASTPGPPRPDPGAVGPRVRAETDPIFLFAPTGLRPFGGVRLLTPHELAQAIEDRAGVAVDVARLPAPIEHGNLGNDAGQLRLRDAGHAKELLVLATHVATQANLAAVIPCKDAVAGCTAADLTPVLAQVFHGPVDGAAVQRYVAVYRRAREQGDHDFARRAVLQTMLVSPAFLYRTELGDGRKDGRLGPGELAAKLSFFLWGTAPDAELRRVAADGTVLDPKVYDAQVARLLADARVTRQVVRLVSEWLGIDDLDLSAKADSARLPAGLRDDMLAEIAQLVGDLVKRDLGLTHLLTSPDAFVNETTAPFYGLTGVKGAAFQRLPLPASQGRRGILTSLAVLAAHGKESGRSPMQRGKLLVNDLTCHGFPPSAGVAVMSLPDGGDTTFRDKFLPLEAAAPCSHCHKVLNAGFALDVFDAVGRRFPAATVADAEARGIFDLPPYDVLRFSSTREALDGFAAHPAVSRCFVTQAYRFAQGRVPDAHDAAALAALEKTFQGNGGGVLRLLGDIARAETFRTVDVR